MAKHTPNELDAKAVHVKALSRELCTHSSEYIALACNSHEALLAACEDALRKLEWPIYTDNEIQKMKPCRDRLKAAIQKGKPCESSPKF